MTKGDRVHLTTTLTQVLMMLHHCSSERKKSKLRKSLYIEVKPLLSHRIACTDYVVKFCFIFALFSHRFLNCRDDDSSPFGPLTQRLVSALIEENIMTPLEDSTMSEAGKPI